MNTVPVRKPNQPPRALRVLLFMLGVILTFLFIWLLGFFINDIRSIEGPVYAEIEKEFVDASLVQERLSLGKELERTDSQINRQREIKTSAETGMSTARETMQQMMDLHRLSLEKGVAPTPEQQLELAESQNRFLAAQQRIDQTVAAIDQLEQQRYDLNAKYDTLTETMEEQQIPARERFHDLMQRHRWWLATLELGLIVPIFLLAAWLFRRGRKSIYRPIFLALLLAASWKIGVAMHEYFPAEFFKYFAIAAAIAITLVFFVRLLRAAARPRVEDLFKRYREAYNQRRCGVCGFPIHRGPWRQAVWTGKGPRASAGGPAESAAEEPYTCPSCGTELFESCGHCAHTRHSLLPYCESCGAQKDVLASLAGAEPPQA